MVSCLDGGYFSSPDRDLLLLDVINVPQRMYLFHNLFRCTQNLTCWPALLYSLYFLILEDLKFHFSSLKFGISLSSASFPLGRGGEQEELFLLCFHFTTSGCNNRLCIYSRKYTRKVMHYICLYSLSVRNMGILNIYFTILGKTTLHLLIRKILSHNVLWHENHVFIKRTRSSSCF